MACKANLTKGHYVQSGQGSATIGVQCWSANHINRLTILTYKGSTLLHNLCGSLLGDRFSSGPSLISLRENGSWLPVDRTPFQHPNLVHFCTPIPQVTISQHVLFPPTDLYCYRTSANLFRDSHFRMHIWFPSILHWTLCIMGVNTHRWCARHTHDGRVIARIILIRKKHIICPGRHSGGSWQPCRVISWTFCEVDSVTTKFGVKETMQCISSFVFGPKCFCEFVQFITPNRPGNSVSRLPSEILNLFQNN
jgi:hypothetical protein